MALEEAGGDDRFQPVAFTNEFGYNQGSEVVHAMMRDSQLVRRSLGEGGYEFDAIGNRIASTNGLAATSYAASALNQYTNVVNRGTFDPVHDDDGNVSEIIDGTGSVRGHYAYDPFGQDSAMTGDLAAINPIRFSTKRQDELTALLYYGYRDTLWGRWVSRDSIGEAGGLNRFTFVLNRPPDTVDQKNLFDWGAINDPDAWDAAIVEGQWPLTDYIIEPHPPEFYWSDLWGGPGWANGQWRSERDPLPQPIDDDYNAPRNERDSCYEQHDQRIRKCPKCPRDKLVECFKSADKALGRCLARLPSRERTIGTRLESVFFERVMPLIRNFE